MAANLGGPHHLPSKGREMEQLKSLRSDVKLAKIGDKIFFMWPLDMNQLKRFLVFREHYERPIIVPTSVWEALEGSTGENKTK